MPKNTISIQISLRSTRVPRESSCCFQALPTGKGGTGGEPGEVDEPGELGEVGEVGEADEPGEVGELGQVGEVFVALFIALGPKSKSLFTSISIPASKPDAPSLISKGEAWGLAVGGAAWFCLGFSVWFKIIPGNVFLRIILFSQAN